MAKKSTNTTKKTLQNAKRSSEAEHTERVNKVYQLLIDGYPRHKILGYIGSKTTWGVSESQIDYYIADAKKIIKQVASETQEEFMQSAKNKFRDLYIEAKNKDDISECRRIVDTANKVLGYEKLNIKHEIDIDSIRDITKEFYNDK